MNTLLARLQRWIKVIQAALVGVVVIETILVIVIGVASNRIEPVLNYWWIVLIACSLIYIFLLVIRTLYQITFPASIIEELIAKRDLEEKIKLLDRQKVINEYIQRAIQNLNIQTCSIEDTAEPKHLCDEDLGVRLKELLQPIISFTDVLLDTSIEKQFTIGVYLDYYLKFPEGHNATVQANTQDISITNNLDLISDQGIIILKDELGLGGIIPKDLLELSNVQGASYEVQSAIRKTTNNLQFNSHDFDVDDKSYTIISSEILEVCSDDYMSGALFIIFKKGVSPPIDLPEVLSIFNRIVANYVSKYNTCIFGKLSNKGD